MAIIEFIQSYDLQLCTKKSKSSHLLIIFPSSEQLPAETGSESDFANRLIEHIWLGFKRPGLEYSAQVMWATLYGDFH